ncbi:MAG: penicillin-binding protein, partial [Geminicoccaceae bacterium]|nr:penicillin-binding protein [Geminicoccaceae bacterium]
VLNSMVETGSIDAEDAEAAARERIEVPARGRGDVGGYFVDFVLDGLTEHLGKPEDDWVISTTLDPRMQTIVERAVSARLGDHPSLQAAVVLIDIHGGIRAMAGGRSYRGDPFNRAASSHRQPGSAFKPFVYLAALDRGWHADSMIEDAPVRVDNWEPKNSGERYFGEVTLEDAFARSLNTVAVRLSEDAGIDRVIEKARRLGIQSELRAVPSIALGTSEVTPLELTASYLPFMSGGIRRPAFSVTRVTDASADLLYAHVAAEVQVISAPELADMQRMLRAVVTRGTGKVAALADREAFGKTGTTSDARDAWFVGYAGDHVAGVWVGRDDNRPMAGISGANLPALIWRDVMGAVPRDAPQAPRPVARPNPEDDPVDLSTQLAKRGLDFLFGWIEQRIEEATR